MAQLKSGSTVGGDDILTDAAGSVDTTQLAADCVTAEKIGNDVINSEHYVAGSIDNEHLAADCVNGAKIANDSINSEHYVAGSIDNEHLANSAVTDAKISGMSSSKLSGALPAIDGSALTNLPASGASVYGGTSNFTFTPAGFLLQVVVAVAQVVQRTVVAVVLEVAVAQVLPLSMELSL